MSTARVTEAQSAAMPYYKRRSKRYTAPAAALWHVAERAELTRQFGGIDGDIERIFLSLPADQLERILRPYGERYGSKAEEYARETMHKWRSGAVKMSGQTATRLLDLLPPVLPPSVRFDLVKKLRARHLQKRAIRVQSSPATWRQDLAKPIQELIGASTAFALPEAVMQKAKWLADGDVKAAQSLLAAAEQEEAVMRIAYVEAEMQRISALMANIDTTRRLTHTLKLPQGDIMLTVELPQRTLFQRLTGWLG